MKRVYVITAENPDRTSRFVDIKGSEIEAENLVKELTKDVKETIGEVVEYQILRKYV